MANGSSGSASAAPLPISVRPSRGHVRSVSSGGGGSGLPLTIDDGTQLGLQPFDEELQPLAAGKVADRALDERHRLLLRAGERPL